MKDVTDNHQEAGRAAPQALRLCQMVRQPCASTSPALHAYLLCQPSCYWCCVRHCAWVSCMDRWPPCRLWLGCLQDDIVASECCVAWVRRPGSILAQWTNNAGCRSLASMYCGMSVSLLWFKCGMRFPMGGASWQGSPARFPVTHHGNLSHIQATLRILVQGQAPSLMLTMHCMASA